MKPVLNIIPKRPMFVCERRTDGTCTEICEIIAGNIHTHTNNEEMRFHCERYRCFILCKEV